jgi:hypothetical protein
MFSLPAFGYQGPFKSPEAQQWHRDRAGVSGELPELHERGRITDGHLDTLVGDMTTRLDICTSILRKPFVQPIKTRESGARPVPRSGIQKLLGGWLCC